MGSSAPLTPFMPRQLLLAEDNDIDARHVLRRFRVYENEIRKQTAARNYRPQFVITHVKDGAAALAALLSGQHDLALLDLNLPRISGIEILEILETETRVRIPPIVIYTSSDNPDEIARVYGLRHGYGFITKPATPEKIGEVVHNFAAYWGATASLPGF